MNFIVFFAVLLGAAFIQITTNLHNDVQDFLNGTDQEGRFGPRRIVHSGLATPKQVMNASFLFAGLAMICGIYLVIIGGWPVVIVGLAGLLCAFGYSSGPYPISRSPFGEILVMIFFGLIAVSMSFYLMTGTFDQTILIYGLIMGFPACAVLFINNYRDLETDKVAGRRTLAILLGRKRGKAFLFLLLFSPYILGPLLLMPLLSPMAFLGGFIMTVICQIKFLKVECFEQYNECLGMASLSQLFLALGLSLNMLIV